MKTQKVAMVAQEDILEAVEKTVAKTIEKTLKKYQKNEHSKYISPKKAMEYLNVRVSKLQELRNQSEIRYAKTSSRGIMYEFQSLEEYLDRNLVSSL